MDDGNQPDHHDYIAFRSRGAGGLNGRQGGTACRGPRSSTNARRSCQRGQVGEICVRGYFDHAGILGRSEKTAKAIDADG